MALATARWSHNDGTVGRPIGPLIDKGNGRLVLVHSDDVGRVFVGGHCPGLKAGVQSTESQVRGLALGVPWALEGTVVLMQPKPTCILF